MPQFTQWNVPDPFPNVLYNPMAVDKAIAEMQSELGTLDINRQKLGIEREKLDAQKAAGAALLGDGTTGTGTSAIPADSTPFEQKMGLSEGGRSATKVNDQGYAGQYQFGASRLADLGLYTPAQGEDLKKNEWKGTFKIAPYGVANLQDFLGSPQAQHAAFVAHVADIDKAIAATPGADKFDVNGLRAVAHLGGNGGMQAFVASGGNLNRADSNGTSLKAYYQKFASGGAPALQQAFGSVHGPGGPPSDTPAVLPGGNVSTAWVDPNGQLPVPPIPPAVGPPPLAGPRATAATPGALPPAARVGTDDSMAKVSYPPQVQNTDANTQAVKQASAALLNMPEPDAAAAYPAVVKELQARGFAMQAPPEYSGHAALQALVNGGQADEAVPVAPSRIALRTGGTDTAGPAAGQTALPPVEQPNRMYQTGLPGVTIGLPANGLAPPPATAQAAAAPATSAPAPTRPPVVAPPPAPSRTIPIEPLIQSGPAAGLTDSQRKIAAAMVMGGTPVAEVGAHMAQWRLANQSGQQQAATNAALEAQANFERQKYYVEQQQKAEQTAYTRGQDAKREAREEVAAKNAGMPPGYRLSDKGIATRIDGLPPDPAVAQAAKDEYDAEQRKKPLQGDAQNAQDRNTLIAGTRNGKVNTIEYRDAYASYATPKVQGDLVIHPQMGPYRLPEDDDGTPITTYNTAHIAVGPGDLGKLRAFATAATPLKFALDEFVKARQDASPAEIAATVAGATTNLKNAWTNAALLAKGPGLYELGALSGPDQELMRGVISDPSTLLGAAVSQDTVVKQVKRLKNILDVRLEQATQSYGSGLRVSGAAPPAAAPAQQTTAPPDNPSAVRPAAPEVGKTYPTPKGPLKWTGTGWVVP